MTNPVITAERIFGAMYQENPEMAELAADEMARNQALTGVRSAPDSLYARDYDIRGRVIVDTRDTESGGLMGTLEERMGQTPLDAEGAAMLGMHTGGTVSGRSMTSNDFGAWSDEKLVQLEFHSDNTFPGGMTYTRPDGTSVTTRRGGENVLNGYEMRELWNARRPNGDFLYREQLAQHYMDSEEQGVIVREVTLPDGTETYEIEWQNVSGEMASRDDGTVDQDAQGNGHQQQPDGEPGEQDAENPDAVPGVSRAWTPLGMARSIQHHAGAVAEDFQSTNSATGQMESLLGIFGTAGVGFSETFIDRNRVGIGGNWDMAGAWTSIGGVAGAAKGAFSLMPSTTLMPGLHVNSGAIAGLSYAVEGVGSVMGAPGLAFRARSVRENMIDIQKTEAVIGTIRNSAIPIEYLIMVVLAHVYDSADKRMRLKLEEIMIAEQMERRREMRQSIIDIFEPIPVAGQIARLAGAAADKVDGMFSGNLKSQAVLTAELQHMFQILKQLMELLSNMSKTMHDMAMVPIRNLR